MKTFGSKLKVFLFWIVCPILVLTVLLEISIINNYPSADIFEQYESQRQEIKQEKLGHTLHDRVKAESKPPPVVDNWDGLFCTKTASSSFDTHTKIDDIKTSDYIVVLIGNLRSFNVTRHIYGWAFSDAKLFPKLIVVSSTKFVDHNDVAWWQNSSSIANDNLSKNYVKVLLESEEVETLQHRMCPHSHIIMHDDVEKLLPWQMQQKLVTHKGRTKDGHYIDFNRTAHAIYLAKITLNRRTYLERAFEYMETFYKKQSFKMDDTSLVIIARPDFYPRSLRHLDIYQLKLRKNPNLVFAGFHEVWGILDQVLIMSVKILRKLVSLPKEECVSLDIGTEPEVSLQCLLRSVCADIVVSPLPDRFEVLRMKDTWAGSGVTKEKLIRRLSKYQPHRDREDEIVSIRNRYIRSSGKDGVDRVFSVERCAVLNSCAFPQPGKYASKNESACCCERTVWAPKPVRH